MTVATSSGVASLDAVLRGGWERGDNVVWLGAELSQVLPFAEAFLDRSAGHKRLVSFGGRRMDVGDDVEVLDFSGIDSTSSISAVVSQLLEGIGEFSKVVIDGLDDIREIWGPRSAVEFYRRASPEMLGIGCLTYWISSSGRTSSNTIDQVAKVAQCVLDVRDDRLRVVKAEGRPPRVNGLVAEVLWTGSGPVIGREQPVGRIGQGLRQLRRDRNFTQSQVAKLAGVTPAAISQAETGRRGLSLETLIGLSDAVGIGVDDLLGTAASGEARVIRHDRIDPQGPSTSLVEPDPDGLGVTLVRLKPDEQGVPPHEHCGRQIILVSTGLLMVEAGENSSVVRPGDAFITPGEGQTIEFWHNMSSEACEFFWVGLA